MLSSKRLHRGVDKKGTTLKKRNTERESANTLLLSRVDFLGWINLPKGLSNEGLQG